MLEPDTASIRSPFASDPEMRELVGLFVSELDERMRQFLDAWEAGDYAMVVRLAHQLRGAAGSYGFPTISDAAGDVEDAAREVIAGVRGVDVSYAALDVLVRCCRRAEAG